MSFRGRGGGRGRGRGRGGRGGGGRFRDDGPPDRVEGSSSRANNTALIPPQLLAKSCTHVRVILS